MPPRNVVPKPVQKPHPPLWVACSRRDTIHLAAQKGIGALTFAFIDPEEARALGRRLLRARSADEGVPIGKAVNPNVACVTTFMCAPTEEEAHRPRPRGRQLLRLLARPTTTSSASTSPASPTCGRVPAAARRGRATRPRCAAAVEQERLGAKVAQDGVSGLRGAVGTPDQIREYLRRYEEAASTRSSSCRRPARTSTSTSWRALELFGREVLPEFMEREERDRRGQGQASWSRSSRRPWPARSTRRRRSPRPTTRSPPSPRRIADTTGGEGLKKFLDDFERDRAAGVRDPGAGIAG